MKRATTKGPHYPRAIFCQPCKQHHAAPACLRPPVPDFADRIADVIVDQGEKIAEEAVKSLGERVLGWIRGARSTQPTTTQPTTRNR